MKKIPYLNYLISEDGKTIIGTGRIKKNISIQTDKDGYKCCNLYLNKVRVHKRVHRLVAETYIPNPNDLPQINHINGIKSDNRICNLEWCTGQENIIHGYKTGLYDNARKMTSARNKLRDSSEFSSMGKANRKLSDLDVINIRHLADTKQKTYKELALLYNYDRSSIGKIVRRERYSEIE